MKIIPFSPPDITDLEIDEVVDTLKSGWITTGKRTKLFEKANRGLYRHFKSRILQLLYSGA